MQPLLRRAAQQCERKLAYRWRPVREEDAMTSDKRESVRRDLVRLRLKDLLRQNGLTLYTTA